MRAILISLLLVGSAHAKPVALICNGNLTADGKEIPINGQTAVLDIENNSFKPPFYSEHPLIRVGDTEITFGSESEKYSTWGSLDRVSGNLAMNVMSPEERKKLKSGASARFMTWMSGKCAPAQRMF